MNYRSEWDTVGKGFTFIWLFLVKVREKIKEVRATNQAFVSLRLMINVRATYEAYRDVIDKIGKQRGKISNQAITQPKTVIEAMDNFFGLFKEAPRRAIMEGVDYAAFKRVVEQKNQMPYNPDAPNFDTPEEIREAQELIRLNEEEIRRRYS